MDDRKAGQPVVRLGRHESHSLPTDAPPTPLDLLDCLGCAAILVDANAKVVGLNARAEGLLGTDLVLRGGGVVASDPASDKLLQDLVRAALSCGPLTTNILLPPAVVQQRDRRPIVVQALPSSGLLGPAGQHTRAILLLTCLASAPEVPESRLILLFRLTPAEARIAAKLGTGEPLEVVADNLRISLGTARNQLKAVFAKTETSRQAELVALLWRISDLAISKALVPA